MAEIKFTVVKGTGVYRAIAIEPDGQKKVIALYGTVKDLAAKELIFTGPVKHDDRWIFLYVGDEASSHEFLSKKDCQYYIKRRYEEGEQK